MKKHLVVLLCLTKSLYAMADQSTCEAAGGSFLTGTVVGAPQFAAARKTIKGVRLSHTHVQLLADQDGKNYDVAMDNVYAVDFVINSDTIPNSLAAIYINDRMELCGNLYGSGIGIHWVHDNCNEPVSNKAPDGWVKEIAPDGTVGNNLEGSRAYCYLWNQSY